MNHTAPEGTNKNEIEVISYSTIQVYLDIALKRFLALLHSNRKKNIVDRGNRVFEDMELKNIYVIAYSLNCCCVSRINGALDTDLELGSISFHIISL